MAKIVAEEESLPRAIKNLESEINRFEDRLEDCEDKADWIRQ